MYFGVIILSVSGVITRDIILSAVCYKVFCRSVVLMTDIEIRDEMGALLRDVFVNKALLTYT